MFNLYPSRFDITKEITLGYLLLAYFNLSKNVICSAAFADAFFKIGLQNYKLFLYHPNFFFIL